MNLCGSPRAVRHAVHCAAAAAVCTSAMASATRGRRSCACLGALGSSLHRAFRGCRNATQLFVTDTHCCPKLLLCRHSWRLLQFLLLLLMPFIYRRCRFCCFCGSWSIVNNGPLRRCKIVVDLVILTFHCSCSMCSCIQLIVYTCDVYVSVSGSILQLLYVGWSIWSFVSRNT